TRRSSDLVLDGPGEWPHAVQRPRDRAPTGAADPSDGRLETDRPTQRGRNAYRAAGVAAERHRHEATADGYAGAAARSARRVRHRVPRVVGCPVIVVDADAAEGELHRMCLADENHAGTREPPHRRAIDGSDVVVEEARSGCRGDSFHVVE